MGRVNLIIACLLINGICHAVSTPFGERNGERSEVKEDDADFVSELQREDELKKEDEAEINNEELNGLENDIDTESIENEQKEEKNEEEVENSEEELDEDASHNTVMDKIFKVNSHVDNQYTEGDIVPNKAESDEFFSKRNALKNTNMLWPNGKVHYEFHRDVPAYDRKVIHTAIDEFYKHTCIKLIRYTENMGDIRRILFVRKGGCWSSVGKQGNKGQQQVSIGRGCAYKGIVMHELMHALGFYHEQSRYDRDQYIKIIWENIPSSVQYNFKAQTKDVITTLGQPYDYNGLMHYGMYAFAKNYSQPTIVPLDKSVKRLGQRRGFSKVDKMQLLALYSCPEVQPGWSTWSPFGPCNDNCMRERKKYCYHDNRTSCAGYDKTKTGILIETKNCTPSECKRDGHWGQWSSWGTCSVTCASGKHSRTRRCDNPSPRSGGAPCPGQSQMVKTCKRGPCNLGPNDCTFEVKNCFWKSNSRRWIRHQFETSSIDTGPTGDHTAFGEGHYIYFEVSQINKAFSAELESKLFPASVLCMSYWYHMNGIDIGKLEVIQRSNKSDILLKTIQGSQGSKWKKDKVEIVGLSDFKIIFRGHWGSGYKGDIALDDIFFKNGLCNSSVVTKQPSTRPQTTQQPTKGPKSVADFDACPFSNSMCGFTVQLGSGILTKSSSIQPDHTNEKGSFLALGSMSRLVNRPLVFDGQERCLEFFTVQQRNAHFRISVVSDAGYRCLDSVIFRNNSNGWQQVRASLSVPAGKTATIMLETSGKILIDDFSLTLGGCQKQKGLLSPGVLNCGFERNFCAWKQVVALDQFNWTRMRGETTSSKTGPNQSATGPNDYYAYIETSNPQRQGDAAILRSPFMSTSSPFCLQLQAMFYKEDIGYFAIVQTFADGNSKVLYRNAKNMDQKWQLLKVDVAAGDIYELSIIATRGISFRGDIAIDELVVHPGPCK